MKLTDAKISLPESGPYEDLNAKAEEVRKKASEVAMSFLTADSYKGKLALFKEHAEYNHSKFESLSKRQKKIFMKQYGRMFDRHSGKLVKWLPWSIRPNHHESTMLVVTFTMIEHVPKAETDFMNAWLNHFLEGEKKDG